MASACERPDNSGKKRPRLVFMGTPELAATILRTLVTTQHQGRLAYDVVGVFCQPDRKAGRGRVWTAPPVKVAALELELEVHQPTRLKDGHVEALLRTLRPDAVVVAAYGRILPPALLATAPRGCINVHASLLPRWRGASPITRCIWHGDAVTGVSIMQMDQGCDTGPVFAQAQLTLAPDETTSSLTARLALLGATTLCQHLPAILRGTLRATPQADVGVTHAPLLDKEDGAIDFRHDATTLSRMVRALHPWPSAYFYCNDVRVIVLDAHPAPNDDTTYTHATGAVLEAGAEGLRVACGRGSLWLTKVKPAGSSSMHAAQWIGGRGPKKGATLKRSPD